MSRLLVDITAHGFGHLAQTAPVLNALRTRRPGLDVTVRTGLGEQTLAARLEGAFRLCPSDSEFGVAMDSPMLVDREATLRRYAALHQDYDAHADRLAAWVAQEGFDAVLSNVSYLMVEAAARAGLPVLAMSSLNWHDIFRHYCAGLDGADRIAAQMHAAYARASAFARLVPGLEMADFDTVPIEAAIASRGTPRRATLLERFGAGDRARIVLVALGGVEGVEPPPWSQEAMANHLLFGYASWGGRGPWRAPQESGLPFVDLVASADLVVTKPGYGIVTEVAAAGVPTLMLARDGWPEEPPFVDWLQAHGRCLYSDRTLESFSLREVLDLCEWLDAAPMPPGPALGGERDVADLMAGLLDGRA